jgi:hypothetical protein
MIGLSDIVATLPPFSLSCTSRSSCLLFGNSIRSLDGIHRIHGIRSVDPQTQRRSGLIAVISKTSPVRSRLFPYLVHPVHLVSCSETASDLLDRIHRIHGIRSVDPQTQRHSVLIAVISKTSPVRSRLFPYPVHPVHPVSCSETASDLLDRIHRIHGIRSVDPQTIPFVLFAATTPTRTLCSSASASRPSR